MGALSKSTKRILLKRFTLREPENATIKALSKSALQNCIDDLQTISGIEPLKSKFFVDSHNKPKVTDRHKIAYNKGGYKVIRSNSLYGYQYRLGDDWSVNAREHAPKRPQPKDDKPIQVMEKPTNPANIGALMAYHQRGNILKMAIKGA